MAAPRVSDSAWACTSRAPRFRAKPQPAKRSVAEIEEAHLRKGAERCVCEGTEAEEAQRQVPQGATVAQTRSRGEQVLARAVLGEHGAQSWLRRAGAVEQKPLPSTPLLGAPAPAQGPSPTPASCLRGSGS
ncbi:hypothetical protein J1605_018208 [Eschrichtius robustus]|uniref:Uncharacterized protein n=1 Tax=Eschrichtius robustus TaxID=9764 RepID=A0AB34HY30_ESCRO|nr:hypothetical protein J1605_018208 [Eschrichtius robustus]